MDNYESLLQFLYQIPIAVARTDSDGNIDMLNPFMTNMLLVLNKGLPFGDSIFDVITTYDKAIKNKLLNENKKIPFI